jgi:hypothetical protein
MHEHIALLSYKSCMNFRKWCELRGNYPPGESSQICALFQLWLDGTCRWGSLQLEGLPGQGMLGFSCAWVFSAAVWNLLLRSAAVSRVPRAKLGQGIRLSGTWVFFLGLEPHIIWWSLCSCRTEACNILYEEHIDMHMHPNAFNIHGNVLFIEYVTCLCAPVASASPYSMWLKPPKTLEYRLIPSFALDMVLGAMLTAADLNTYRKF